ncbi:hypothetical protein K458DRAFT_434425 [Lentithecium fluviatile CBS 122367]|uniref:Ferric oxidoreductase domain-containing protein n=1 Tax=Lentithecium fluviatile CBS 122367 TaxID=1168545 RepID=A0A6G1IQP8_9PLEO|nr:hypothetical protein K458DRAFT_434425 [Lentithecium fluviatile CBS 122367]
MSYSDALAMDTEPPTKYLVSSMSSVLNETMLANQSTMALQKSTLYSVGYEGRLEGRYGVGILVAFFAPPILIIIIGYLPFMTSISESIKPYLIWPSIIETYHVRPLSYRLGNAPIMGQSLYVFAFVVVNIVMTATGYRVAIPHAWYGNGKYYAVMTSYYPPWWIWGIIGTPAITIMVVGSGLYVRKWSYEVFLIKHIILAVLTFVGTWYHIWYCFQWLGNYQQPLFAACSVWFFDRFIRVMRILKNGVRRAQVTEIGQGYVRIDVPGIHFWPKFICALSHSQQVASMGEPSILDGNIDIENKNRVSSKSRSLARGTTTEGVTFFVRKSTGMARYLSANDSLMAFLDGSYPNNPIAAIMRTDRLLVITGEIGVSGVLPWLFAHPNVKFAWSVKKNAECLVTALDVVLDGVVDKDVSVGSRLDLQALVNQDIEAGWKKVGVMVCGPGGLCDDVRATVCAASKGPTAFELEVDAYSW